MDKIDITVTQLSRTEHVDLETSQLKLKFKGSSVNCSVVNALRGVSYDLIPTYAFHPAAMKIEKNTSKFNNDMLRLKISQITYPGFTFKHPSFKLDTFILPEKYCTNVDYSDRSRELYEKDKYKIEMYINVKNNTHSTLNVTSHDITFYENGEKIKYPYKKSPCLILGLNPGEEFMCYCVGQLGIGDVNNIWSAAANAYFEQLKDDESEYDFVIESMGQISEYEIMHKACNLIKIKLERFKDIVDKQYNTKEYHDSTRIKLVLPGEGHALGQLLNRTFQMHKSVLFSGVAMLDNLVSEITFKIVTDKVNPVKVIFECVEYAIKLMDSIDRSISSMHA
jgi:DNA-directed RNA polymerase subunit L